MKPYIEAWLDGLGSIDLFNPPQATYPNFGLYIWHLLGMVTITAIAISGILCSVGLALRYEKLPGFAAALPYILGLSLFVAARIRVLRKQKSIQD